MDVNNKPRPGMSDQRQTAGTKIFLKRHARLVLVLFLAFLIFVAEVMAEGLVIGYHYYKGRGDPTLFERLMVTSVIVAPFLSRNPIHQYTSAEYIGDIYETSAQRRWYTGDPILGWRLGKNVGSTKIISGTNILSWKFTNDQGFVSLGERAFRIEKPKPKGLFRIIFLGGSTVEGDGSESPDKSLPAMFRQNLLDLLKESGYLEKPSLEVVNAGVGRYASTHELIQFITRIVDYEPDLVIVYNGWNERVINQLFATYGELHNPFITKTHMENEERINDSYSLIGAGRIFLGALYATVRRLTERSGIFASLDLVLQKFSGMARQNADVTVTARPVPLHPKTVEVYRRNLESILVLARHLGIRIGIFLQPLIGIDGKIYPIEEAKWLANTAWVVAFYEEARSAFREMNDHFGGGACIADVSRTFEGHSERLYEDRGHLLGVGNDLIARRLLRELRFCGLLSPLLND